MQISPALGPGSLISGSVTILELVLQDPFYAVYSGESTTSDAIIGITEYYPADLVARAPSGDVLLRSSELQDVFNLGRDRFMAEANALVDLRHPNLLRFDGVLSGHGTAFALHAAEEGQSITNVAKSSKQPPTQEVIDAILRKLLSALELLHSRGLIHANITPDTILLRPDPLLVRFGATRSFLAARMRKVNLAVTSGYSAPELRFFDEKANGPLCDVYSLAAVLYFVVTGRHPINEIARRLGHTMPPAAALPSQRFRTQFLEAIDRGLELEPQHRPATMKAFGEMLLGIPEKKASESTQPVLQMAANLAECSQVRAAPSAAPPNGKPSPATNPVPKPPASTPSVETVEIKRLLVVTVVLVLLISAGMWMLEAQFKKQPERAAHLDARNAASERVGSDHPVSKEQPPPAGSNERSPTASPSEQTPVPPPPQAEQLGEKIKEAEEKRDKAKEQQEGRVEASSSPVSGQKQDNEVRPETKSESERERLKETVQKQQSLMLTLSAERQRIEAEQIAAEQMLNERLKEQKLAHDCEPLQEKSASGNKIDKPLRSDRRLHKDLSGHKRERSLESRLGGAD